MLQQKILLIFRIFEKINHFGFKIADAILGRLICHKCAFLSCSERVLP
jgi:hypothetical protein